MAACATTAVTDDLSRFNVFVRNDFDMPEFNDGFYNVIQARHRHGTTHTVIMSIEAWKVLEPLSLVPIPNCMHVVVSGKGVTSSLANGVCHVGTLTAALRACANFQGVDMAFVLGDVALEASTRFVDGIDYVYVQTQPSTATLQTSVVPWYEEDDVSFERLTTTAVPAIYRGRTRTSVPRTLAPWVIQQLQGELDQAQYARVLATVVRNGVFDSVKHAYVQAGIRLQFALTSDMGEQHVPVLQTVLCNDYERPKPRRASWPAFTDQHGVDWPSVAGMEDADVDFDGFDASGVFAAAKTLYDKTRLRVTSASSSSSCFASNLIDELGAKPYFCVSAGSMTVTAIVPAGNIDAVHVAAIAIAVHIEARRQRVVPCQLVLVYPTLAVPVWAESQCLRLISSNRAAIRVDHDMAFIDDVAATLY